jgi:hypothetical protein
MKVAPAEKRSRKQVRKECMHLENFETRVR